MRTGKHDRQHGAAFAKGGNTRMFGKQAAGPDRPGNTGKDQTPAPGAKSAKGGRRHMHPYTPAQPAKVGVTGVRKSAR